MRYSAAQSGGGSERGCARGGTPERTKVNNEGDHKHLYFHDGTSGLTLTHTDGDVVNHLMLGNYDCIMVADIAIGLQLPPLLAVSTR